MAAGIPFLDPNANSESFSGRVLRTALDLGVLNASFSVTSAHAIHPDAALENVFAFAESQGALIAESVRQVCYEIEQMPSAEFSRVF
jgi:hypothetical protein